MEYRGGRGGFGGFPRHTDYDQPQQQQSPWSQPRGAYQREFRDGPYRGRGRGDYYRREYDDRGRDYPPRRDREFDREWQRERSPRSPPPWGPDRGYQPPSSNRPQGPPPHSQESPWGREGREPEPPSENDREPGEWQPPPPQSPPQQSSWQSQRPSQQQQQFQSPATPMQPPAYRSDPAPPPGSGFSSGAPPPRDWSQPPPSAGAPQPVSGWGTQPPPPPPPPPLPPQQQQPPPRDGQSQGGWGTPQRSDLRDDSRGDYRGDSRDDRGWGTPQQPRDWSQPPPPPRSGGSSNGSAWHHSPQQRLYPPSHQSQGPSSGYQQQQQAPPSQPQGWRRPNDGPGNQPLQRTSSGPRGYPAYMNSFLRKIDEADRQIARLKEERKKLEAAELGLARRCDEIAVKVAVAQADVVDTEEVILAKREFRQNKLEQMES
eukprot:TRINITY_DN400_c0_g1_i1.p1 TRINITY_DN400_c0_g1~~TRINITY_DN400_c0_g1_i1.p1  ORF type:complete len:430 (-),score=84.21 TRINITY_DN400_c0_g1_i1:51-1340(-)